MRRIFRRGMAYSQHEYIDEQRRVQWLTRIIQTQRGSQTSVDETAEQTSYTRMKQTQGGSQKSFHKLAQEVSLRWKGHRIIDENDNDLLDLLTRYRTRKRNTRVFDLKSSCMLPWVRFTQVSNLSNFLASLLVPSVPKIQIAGRTVADQIVSQVTSLLDSRHQA
jgi:hypothetical protein